MPHGRELFRRYRPLLNALSRGAKALPRELSANAWNLSNLLPEQPGAGVRYSLMKAEAKNCGDNVFIGPYVVIKGTNELSIGSNVSIHASCYVDASGGVTIGNDVSIAHATSILAADHTWGNPDTPIKYNPVKWAPVVIEDDVWIGCGVRILSGVTIGRRCVIAAGAVVTRNVPPGTLSGGVPARPLKTIPV